MTSGDCFTDGSSTKAFGGSLASFSNVSRKTGSSSTGVVALGFFGAGVVDVVSGGARFVVVEDVFVDMPFAIAAVACVGIAVDEFRDGVVVFVAVAGFTAFDVEVLAPGFDVSATPREWVVSSGSAFSVSFLAWIAGMFCQ